MNLNNYGKNNKSPLSKMTLIQEESNPESKEDKFFLTRARINKNTQIDIKKVFFPEKFKRSPCMSLEKINNLDDDQEDFSRKYPCKITNFYSVRPKKKIPKLHLIQNENQNKALYNNNEKELQPLKTNLTISLNNELSRISSVYGKENSFKKFTDNPKSNQFYEERNFLRYEMTKINEFSDVHIKPKLKPLFISKQPTLNKLSESIFNIIELGSKVDLNESN